MGRPQQRKDGGRFSAAVLKLGKMAGIGQYVCSNPFNDLAMLLGTSANNFPVDRYLLHRQEQRR
jgi:hypothetical protein